MRPVFFSILSLSLLALPRLQAEQSLLITAGGKLNHFHLDAATGGLAVQEAPAVIAWGPLGTSPDGKLIYINASISSPEAEQGATKPAKGGKKKRTPAIATAAFGESGALKILATVKSGMSAGYLHTDSNGRFLAANNYGEGKVAVWGLDEDGVYRGAGRRQIMDLERCAHAAVFSPDDRTLFVPATAPNKIFQLKFDAETGAVVPGQPSSTPGPGQEPAEQARQPRHLLFHPSLPVAYATHEREFAGVGVYDYDTDKAILELRDNHLAVDPADSEGVSTATLRFGKDAKFLYVSRRDGLYKDQPEKARDGILQFAVDPKTGALTKVGEFACPQVPRSFCIDRTGQFLFVGGQADSRLASYRIDAETGGLEEFGQRRELPGGAFWLLCIER